MLAWIRSPRGSTATATAIAAILALVWFAPWQRTFPVKLPFAAPARDAAPAVATTAPVVTSAAPADTPVPAAANAAATLPEPTPATGAPGSGNQQAALTPAAPSPPPGAGAQTAAAPDAPSFDVVRVEPSGEAVIAGRAIPGADVSLMDGDKAVAHVKVDASGQFALLPPALPEGSHYLTLKMERSAQTPLVSAQGVAVTIAKPGTKPLVALLSPDKPAQVLSDGAPDAAPKTAGGATPAAATPVAIQAVEAAEGGKFLASGVARAGSQCRVYLNGAYLADVTAGTDGKWSVEVKKGMKPGRYTVRADELEASSGKVVNRAEVPFDYPATMAVGEARRQLIGGTTPPAALGPLAAATPDVPSAAVMASAASSDGAAAVPPETQAVIASLSTATVVHGDSLWRISRRMLGHGIQYTQIYASNASQIRNPRLIYPGQIFVVPSKPPT